MSNQTQDVYGKTVVTVIEDDPAGTLQAVGRAINHGFEAVSRMVSYGVVNEVLWTTMEVTITPLDAEAGESRQLEVYVGGLGVKRG